MGSQPMTIEEQVIGRCLAELVTPMLLVDLTTLSSNIETMAAMTSGPVHLRPHVKTHKMPAIARMQVEAGAVGVTAATVWEAVAMIEGGIDDVLIANEVVGPWRHGLLAGLARRATVCVAVDSIDNVDQLELALEHEDASMDVLIEVDVGMGRGGVRSMDEAVLLARAIEPQARINLRGIMGYEGHCVLDPHLGNRRSATMAAIQLLAGYVSALEDDGHGIDIVSAAGTGTYRFAALEERVVVNELQAGSYVFMDSAYEALVPEFGIALTVASTVVSKHGRTVVLDCGSKALGVDNAPPRLKGRHGEIVHVSEEHSVFTIGSEDAMAVGDVVEIVPGHCCATVNLHPVMAIVEDGVVADVWRTEARGPGYSALT